jgi:ADP-ribose pyrophosphatase
MIKSSIPPKAEKVFKGIIFDVYQWPQKMFDGKTQIFEGLKRDDTATVIPVLENGKVLLTRQSQPNRQSFIDFPGGRVDDDEDPLVNAKRELKEETGLISSSWELLLTVQLTAKIDWLCFLYLAKDCKYSGSQELDSGEKISCFEVTFDELVEISTEDNFRCEEFKKLIYQTKFQKDKLDKLKKELGIP